MYEHTRREAAIDFDKLPKLREQALESDWLQLQTSKMEWEILAGVHAAKEWFYIDDSMHSLDSFAFAL